MVIMYHRDILDLSVCQPLYAGNILKVRSNNIRVVTCHGRGLGENPRLDMK